MTGRRCPAFSKLQFEFDPFLPCLIERYDMGVVQVSLNAWFEFNVYKNWLRTLRRHIISNSGVFFFVQRFFVLD